MAKKEMTQEEKDEKISELIADAAMILIKPFKLDLGEVEILTHDIHESLIKIAQRRQDANITSGNDRIN